ncbi:receptor like protein 21 [Gastrolobium bilobum]|uniref:receptor like protein 21 n=1 Tax=Gastrolobium bilobum TaxID=150636 RepID=UPI002AAF926B|nr:receptor like protein 21 [Gastrolobium bilobum]
MNGVLLVILESTWSSNQSLGLTKKQASRALQATNRHSCLNLRLLQNNNISGKIPRELGILPKLQPLDLSNNRLCGVIPGSLSQLNSLQYLILGLGVVGKKFALILCWNLVVFLPWIKCWNMMSEVHKRVLAHPPSQEESRQVERKEN